MRFFISQTPFFLQSKPFAYTQERGTLEELVCVWWFWFIFETV